jgi:hypothetical protein
VQSNSPGSWVAILRSHFIQTGIKQGGRFDRVMAATLEVTRKRSKAEKVHNDFALILVSLQRPLFEVPALTSRTPQIIDIDTFWNVVAVYLPRSAQIDALHNSFLVLTVMISKCMQKYRASHNTRVCIHPLSVGTAHPMRPYTLPRLVATRKG